MQGQGDISVEFSAYLDGQLTPEAARWVDRAAAESPDVARRLHDLRRIRTILRAIQPVSPGPDFVARVLAEARRRGLMRRVVRERMLQGVIRLASAAAAVLLVAFVAGVAVQGFMHQSGPFQPHGTRGGQAAPAVAVAPRPGSGETSPGGGMKGGKSEELLARGSGSAAPAVTAGATFRKGDVERLAALGSRVRTLNLAVMDLGAGAKEVAAVLADAGITRFSAGGRQLDSADQPDARLPAPKPAAAPAKPGADELTGFSLMPGESDELRFLVMAPPDRIDAVTRRLDSLRQKENPEESSNGLCIAGVSRPAAAMPKAASTQPDSLPAAKAVAASPAEPYHAANLQRLPNASQLEARQSRATTVPASQAAGAPGPPASGMRNEAIIITVRLRRADTNGPDPMRNLKQR
jgi:hypothetical protein